MAPFTEDEKAVMRDEAAKLIHDKKYRTVAFCKEKMTTLEDNVKSLNIKLWGIILLLVANLASIAVASYGGQ